MGSIQNKIIQIKAGFIMIIYIIILLLLVSKYYWIAASVSIKGIDIRIISYNLMKSYMKVVKILSVYHFY